MKFHNLKLRMRHILIILVICNIIPTCEGYKNEALRSFAMPVNFISPLIINFSPQVISNKESIFVNVKGAGFDKNARLLVKRFLIGGKYLDVLDDTTLIVKVPKGVPVGKYPVALKNPDGRTSNVVWVEVKG